MLLPSIILFFTDYAFEVPNNCEVSESLDGGSARRSYSVITTQKPRSNTQIPSGIRAQDRMTGRGLKTAFSVGTGVLPRGGGGERPGLTAWRGA